MKKRILVAPLNWGLGHATRCIPIINALAENGFEPVIASDGEALKLLKKEFPSIHAVELPSYHIRYAKKGKFFKWKIIQDTPKLIRAVTLENLKTKSILKEHKIDGIISDNRLGVFNKRVPSVFITHQLNVLSGNTTKISTKIHELFINQFNVCWVPDHKGEINLSGKLGHKEKYGIPTTHIGPISRFKPSNVKPINDVLVLLSGPEPQRSILEEKLLKEFLNYKGNVLFVRGIIQSKQEYKVNGSITMYNFMTSQDLEQAINESALVVSRSGYTTIMDLAKLGKPAFFIPTPGQFEQEYLAKTLHERGIVPSCSQDEFKIEKLKEVKNYSGLPSVNGKLDFNKLFSFFQSE
ncbi:glycosyltransferase [Mangrovimonas aestuarii]|uniref:glycosyltransferase n=1 Tax=Mangrovimonas aestuarii TaxID=3018443 RepID=UPI0023786FD4|nr:glycosyltransferase [Mangrovimonas aestuarii]